METAALETLGAVGLAPDLLGRAGAVAGETPIWLPTSVTRLTVAAITPAITAAAAGSLIVTAGVSLSIVVSADSEVS